MQTLQQHAADGDADVDVSDLSGPIMLMVALVAALVAYALMHAGAGAARSCTHVALMHAAGAPACTCCQQVLHAGQGAI